MSKVELMTLRDMRENYLRSLTPVERMDYELACAREKRLVAERDEERRETEALLLRIDEAEGAGSEPHFVLSWQEFRLLRRELRRLKGEGDARPSPWSPQAKGRAERAHRRQTGGAA